LDWNRGTSQFDDNDQEKQTQDDTDGWMKSFALYQEDAKVLKMSMWKRIKWETANHGLPGKWPLTSVAQPDIPPRVPIGIISSGDAHEDLRGKIASSTKK